MPVLEFLSSHTYCIQVSTDNGRTWQTVGVGLKRPTLELDRTQFRAGQEVGVRMVATNGLQRSVVMSDIVRIWRISWFGWLHAFGAHARARISSVTAAPPFLLELATEEGPYRPPRDRVFTRLNKKRSQVRARSGRCSVGPLPMRPGSSGCGDMLECGCVAPRPRTTKL